MKLGKLLAAGKSIMSGRTDISYRSSKQIYLPKFGPAKNPFKPEAVQPAEEVAADPAIPQPTRAAAPADNIAAMAKKTPAVPEAKQKKNTNWERKFNLVSIFQAAMPKRVVNSSGGDAKTRDKVATQPELSLDSVKVVHNDLSDADVEVVPMKSRAGAPGPQLEKKALEFWGERLFGVEAT